MNQPSVSIIVPVFNEEKHLSECLESAMNQTLDNIEIIVVNDCSTDNSIKIINDYAKNDVRIRLISHDHNKGRSESRNSGINLACGKYIYFLDSDDSLPSNSLEELHTIAIKFGSELVLGGFTSKVAVDSLFVKCNLYNVSITNYPDLLYNHSVLNKLINRQTLLENEILFSPPRCAEDILFSLRLNLEFKLISITTAKTYNYRWGRQLKSATKEKLLDAQTNVIAAFKAVEKYNNDTLSSTMREKTVKTIFGTMARAVKTLNRSELQSYLKNWNQALSTSPDSFNKELPKPVIKFCKYIYEEKYDAAIKYWRVVNFLKSIRRALIFPPGISNFFTVWK